MFVFETDVTGAIGNSAALMRPVLIPVVVVDAVVVSESIFGLEVVLVESAGVTGAEDVLVKATVVLKRPPVVI